MDINATLPEEVILQIVARVPVKSVGRCRCVSTRWRSLFSDPEFAKSQFQVSPKHQSLIFQPDNGELKTLGLDLSEKESPCLRDLEAPFDHISLQFLGSCNGLVAARDFRRELDGKQEGLFIWNPSTKFFKKLPARRGELDDDDNALVGFGCVSSNDEYKLVMGAEVFSSKTSSWTPIDIPSGIFAIWMTEGVLCKGALHWIDYTDEHRGQLRLYAFDLENEEFSTMKLPSACTQWNSIYDFNATCEGCLCVLAERPVQDCGCVVEFWVMREYGNSDSWARSLSIKIPTQPEWNNWLRVTAISVIETSAFVWALYPGEELETLSTIYFCNTEENTGFYTIDLDVSNGVVYEESLCCLV